jgi:diguanylate cyclase (GGDEF)-like protein
VKQRIATGLNEAYFSPEGHAMKTETEGRIPLDDLLVFHQLTRSLTSSLDLNTVLRTILEQMERTVHADLWTLVMLDEGRQELYYALAAGGEQEALRDLRVKVGEGVAGWVVQHGETLIVPEAQDDPRWNKSSRMRSIIALPLRGRKGTQGAIEIFNPRSDQMTDYTIAFLHILADHAAIAIENARDMERIQHLTITDDTTGLYNVRHLYDVLGRELERSSSAGLPLSIAFLDLDRFKQVNDVHGHLVGSELLAHVGQRLQDLSGEADLCFRYGGDEFIVLMPESDAETALVRAETLLGALMDTDFSMKNGLALKIGASIGLATAPNDGATLHAIIGAADARMYEVKSNGRGQVKGD